MSILFNFPWIAKALVFLGLFTAGFFAGAPFWLWLRGIVSKRMLPSMIMNRKKARKAKIEKERQIQVLTQKLTACRSLYRETGIRIDAIMNEQGLE